MRVNVRKFLFFGLADDCDAFFRAAQEKGIVEFIDENHGFAEASILGQKLLSAHKVLQGLPVVEQEDVEDLSDAESRADEILSLRHDEEQLREERRMLKQEVARIEPFGRFSLDDIRYIEQHGHMKIQYFASKHGTDHPPEVLKNLFFVSSAHGLDYFVSVQPEAMEIEGMIEMRLEKPLPELLARISEVETALHKGDERLKALAKYDNLLRSAMVEEVNRHSLHTARDLVASQVDHTSFSVSGWVGQDNIEQLRDLIQEHNVTAEEVAIEEDDRVPTHLVNAGFARIGEDLVNIYDTPGTDDKDPSSWVFWAFALFFAIIVGDGGYGMLFLALGLWLGYKIPKPKAGMARAIRLTKVLGVSCIFWGFMTGSFFGMNLGFDNPIRQFSALHWAAEMKAEYHANQADDTFWLWAEKFPAITSSATGHQVLYAASKSVDGVIEHPMMNEFYDNILLELALLVGTLHVILSLARYVDRSWANAGWILFLIGGYLYVPEYLQATSLVHFLFGWGKAATAETGMHLLQGGLGLALLLAIIQHRLMGVLEIANLIQVFADVLSYLRLYALALAGAIVSATINEIAGSVALVFGVLLIVFGHAVNIILSVMGGVIHGLRLNFIEWYHYCFDGGGRQFSPLRLLKND